MARAYGSSAHLLMKRETVYGQAATGDFIRMPFNRCNLGSEQGLIDDPVLGQGRDPLAPLQDVINDEGDIVVPVDPRYLGLWLTGLFGDPTSSDNGDGSFDHEFTSGSDDLPSYTVEVGMPKVPAFFIQAGVKLNSIALEFTRSGAAAATINAIAQGETRYGTTQGGTPTSLTFSRISQFQGSIKRAGSAVGNLTGGSVTGPRHRSSHRGSRSSPGCRRSLDRELGLGQIDLVRGQHELRHGRERVGELAQLLRELAVRHITHWTGVELEGGRAPPTPENVAAVMELYPVGERFFQEFTLRQVLLERGKKRMYGRLPLCKGVW